MKIINMLIQIIENIIKFFVCKILRIDLSDDMCYKIMQFVKFGFVGLSKNNARRRDPTILDETRETRQSAPGVHT